MKTLIPLVALSLLIFSCKNAQSETETPDQEEAKIVGEWDNFQQYWLENTETDIHRVETDNKHRHFSLRVNQGEKGNFLVELREGRNGQHLVEKMTLREADLSSADFKMDGDTLLVSGRNQFENKDPYKFIRVRKFSGWIEVPIQQYKDSIYRKANLEIHDQGGMAEIDIDGVQYTAEITQLLFGHKLPIMKLAIYDIPMDSVGINSRSISYTWLNPEAKRTGINLRKVITGWTFIEPGFINSDNTKFDKK